MTTEEIKAKLMAINADSGDPEEAHGMEDELYVDFVKYVASLDDLSSLSEKAKLVLSSRYIRFPRWCG